MALIGLPSSDRDAFLRAMRRVANSVAVVTTGGTAGRHGATVSAFSSVSADPPMVLVCLRTGSRIAEAIAANGTLCVNVLPYDRSDLANRFAGRDDHITGDRFQGVDLTDAAGAVPQIDGATVFAGVVDQAVPPEATAFSSVGCKGSSRVPQHPLPTLMVVIATSCRKSLSPKNTATA